MMAKAPKRRVHPTRRKLVDTVVELRGTLRADEISVEQVLEESGVSRGSLYHHFEDFFELIEAAELSRFCTFVDNTIEALDWLLLHAHSKQEFSEGMRELNAKAHAVQLSSLRSERVSIAQRAIGSERFRNAFSIEQERLTDAICSVLTVAQDRGWVDPTLNTKAVAVMVQAYSFGRVLDDLTDERVDPAEWNRLVDVIFERAFLTP